MQPVTYHFMSEMFDPTVSPFGPVTLRLAQKLSSIFNGCWNASTPTVRSVEIWIV